jgi:hypothetical protein
MKKVLLYKPINKEFVTKNVGFTDSVERYYVRGRNKQHPCRTRKQSAVNRYGGL